MSDLNEEFLNDVNDADYPDLGDADEDALLQDDEETDVLELAVEEELGDTLEDSQGDMSEMNHEEGKRQDKFTTERKLITAPESYSERINHASGTTKRPYQRSNFQKGYNKKWPSGRNSYPQQNYQDNLGKSKTVLINPRFQGVVTVENSGWNGPPQQQWTPNAPPHMQMHSQYPVYQQQPQLQQQAPYWQNENHLYPPYNQVQNQFQSDERVIYPHQQPPPPGNVDFQPRYDCYVDYNNPGPPQQYNFPSYENREHYNNMGQRHQFDGQKRRGGGSFVPNKKRFFNNQGGFSRPGHAPQGRFGTRPTVVKQITVSEAPNVQVSQEDDEDAETRDLRRKIEEQRRKREEILRWKENRRKQLTQQQSAADVRPVHAVRPFPKANNNNLNKSPNILLTNGRRLTVHQKKTIAKLKSEKTEMDADVQTIVKEERHVSDFLSERRVVVKDESLLDTRAVFVKNLSTSTSNKKILGICRTIGDIQKLQRDKNERNATIIFKSVASAHAFFKRYQRHMLDLSMIEVSLTALPDTEQM